MSEIALPVIKVTGSQSQTQPSLRVQMFPTRGNKKKRHEVLNPKHGGVSGMGWPGRKGHSGDTRGMGCSFSNPAALGRAAQLQRALVDRDEGRG